jgi:tRNA(Ile)-lysidine synthase TilS/MesJ
MNPRQKLFAGKIVIIRPLCFVEEEQIRVFAREHNFPAQLCQCPFGAASKRKLIKEAIKGLSSRWPALEVRDNLFQSFSNSGGYSSGKHKAQRRMGICI